MIHELMVLAAAIGGVIFNPNCPSCPNGGSASQGACSLSISGTKSNGVAGTVVGVITATNCPGTNHISIDNVCAASFALTSTSNPTTLRVGPANLASGSYPCTIREN